MTDPIADMLSRIRNASMVRKNEVVLPMSKTKFNIAQIMEKEGWIQKAEVVKGGLNNNESQKGSKFDQIKIVLKYKKSGKSVISSIKRISKPGLKVYTGYKELPVVLNGFGIAIISTPKGLLTNKNAKLQKIGGEVICEIY